jgi:hypothetical protein
MTTLRIVLDDAGRVVEVPTWLCASCGQVPTEEVVLYRGGRTWHRSPNFLCSGMPVIPEPFQDEKDTEKLLEIAKQAAADLALLPTVPKPVWDGAMQVMEEMRAEIDRTRGLLREALGMFKSFAICTPGNKCYDVAAKIERVLSRSIDTDMETA